MSLPRWFVFPCSVDTGPDGYGPPQTDTHNDFIACSSLRAARGLARHFCCNADFDYAAIVQYVPGKGLELYGTFGFRPARNEYDLVGTRANSWVIVRKWCEQVLSVYDDEIKKEVV